MRTILRALACMADIWKPLTGERLIRFPPGAIKRLCGVSKSWLTRIIRHNWLGRNLLALLPGFISYQAGY